MGCENTNIGTGEKGCYDNTLQETTILFFEEEVILDISSLQDQTAMQSLISSATNRMSVLSKANYMEPTAAEAQWHEPDYGSKIKTGDKYPSKLFKHMATECLKRMFNEIDGTIGHVLFVTEGNFIEGLAYENDKLKTAKVSINVTDEVIDKIAYKNIDLGFFSLFDSLSRSVDLGFNIEDLTLIEGVYFYPQSANATTFIVEANDCAYNTQDGLDTANFVLWNVTTGAAITVTGWVDNADGSYTATYASGTSTDDVVQARYTGPSATNMYIQILTSNITVTA